MATLEKSNFLSCGKLVEFFQQALAGADSSIEEQKRVGELYQLTKNYAENLVKRNLAPNSVPEQIKLEWKKYNKKIEEIIMEKLEEFFAHKVEEKFDLQKEKHLMSYFREDGAQACVRSGMKGCGMCGSTAPFPAMKTGPMTSRKSVRVRKSSSLSNTAYPKMKPMPLPVMCGLKKWTKTTTRRL